MPLDEDELFSSEFWITTKSFPSWSVPGGHACARRGEIHFAAIWCALNYPSTRTERFATRIYWRWLPALVKASASMLIEQINGQSVEVVRQFTARHAQFCRGQVTPNRQKCCRLLARLAVGDLLARSLGSDNSPGRELK